MAENIERQEQIIYSRINPVDTTLKTKMAEAFQDVVNRIKDKHLS